MVSPSLRTPVGDERNASSGIVSVGTEEGYERWAPIYDDVPNPLLAREERHLLPLLPDLRDKLVLDLACGTGRWLERLMTQGARSGVGVDRSAAMLRIAKRKSGIRQRLVEAACESLPVATASVDFAICSFALGHTENPGALAQEFARVTAPGGDIFISDLHPEAYARGWRVGFRDGATAIQIRMWPRPVDEIVRTFCLHGFECRSHVSLWLGESERPLFAQAKKSDSFIDACGGPAVFVCHFRPSR